MSAALLGVVLALSVPAAPAAAAPQPACSPSGCTARMLAGRTPAARRRAARRPTIRVPVSYRQGLRVHLCTRRRDIDPPFRVHRRLIKMADGHRFTPCGSTISGPHGKPVHWPAQLSLATRTIRDLVRFWGVNTVRIMTFEKWLLSSATRSTYLTFLEREIAAVRHYHAAVLLQAFRSGGCRKQRRATCRPAPSSRNPREGTVDFWQVIRKDLPGLDGSATLLDLYNEPSYPHLRHPWRLWEKGRWPIIGFQKIADALAGTRDVLIVDGPVVSQTLAKVTPRRYHIVAPAGTGGIAYGLHHPALAWRARSVGRLRRYLTHDFGRAARHYPVIFTEWSGASASAKVHGVTDSICWPHAGGRRLYQAFLRYIGRRDGRSIGLVVFGTQAWQNRLETTAGRPDRITRQFRCQPGGMHPQQGAGRLVYDYFHDELPR